jgi:hypothetical protein
VGHETQKVRKDYVGYRILLLYDVQTNDGAKKHTVIVKQRAYSTFAVLPFLNSIPYKFSFQICGAITIFEREKKNINNTHKKLTKRLENTKLSKQNINKRENNNEGEMRKILVNKKRA